jgi:hypothetical protein
MDLLFDLIRGLLEDVFVLLQEDLLPFLKEDVSQFLASAWRDGVMQYLASHPPILSVLAGTAVVTLSVYWVFRIWGWLAGPGVRCQRQQQPSRPFPSDSQNA